MLTLKDQEIPLNDPESHFMFQPDRNKLFVATPAAIAVFRSQIHHCLAPLQEKAAQHNGLDYLQVFVDSEKQQNLWFIENDEAITALLPSDY
jgi:hypothetical protein